MRRHHLILLTILSLIAAACGGTSEAARLEFDVSNMLVTPGATEVGAIDVDGTTVDYLITLPEGFAIGDTAPVLLALPPGGQNLEITTNVANAVYHSEAIRLGWVVVSPAAPNGELFFDGGEDVLPGFVDWIEAWVTPEGGAPHVAGISNGGISAFRYAAQNPDRIASLVVFPGMPRGDDDRAALAELSDVPVRMHVGGNDTGWIAGSEDAFSALIAAGANVRLETYPGEDHVIQSTSDGTIIFSQLESFRS